MTALIENVQITVATEAIVSISHANAVMALVDSTAHLGHVHLSARQMAIATMAPVSANLVSLECFAISLRARHLALEMGSAYLQVHKWPVLVMKDTWDSTAPRSLVPTIAAATANVLMVFVRVKTVGEIPTVDQDAQD